jgi:TRAP-type C4-dicarboxylate transport system permease small subunit
MTRLYRMLVEGLAAAAALILGATAAAVTIDVFARNVGLGAFPWVLEASEYALPLATFLAAPWLLAKNEHVRLDMLLHALPSRAARALDGASNLLGLAICAVLVVYGVRTILDSAQQGAMIVKSLVFPEWWIYAPVPLSFALLAFEFLRRLAAREAPAVGSGPRA